MSWLQRHAFEVVMGASVVAAVVVLAATARPSSTPDAGAPFAVGISSGNWVVQAVGPNYDPIYVRAGRRIYVVEEDGGVRRCGR